MLDYELLDSQSGVLHIKWWRHSELSVIFMIFHPRPPFNVVLSLSEIDATSPFFSTTNFTEVILSKDMEKYLNITLNLHFSSVCFTGLLNHENA